MLPVIRIFLIDIWFQVENTTFFYRIWSIVRIFVLPSECYLCVSSCGLSSHCKEDYVNREYTELKSTIGELTEIETCEKNDIEFVFTWFVCVVRQRQYSWVLYTWWGRSEKHREEMLSERMVCNIQMQTILLIIENVQQTHLFAGDSSRGAWPHAESVGTMETTHRAAAQRHGKTGGVTPSVPSETSSQDHDWVEGQQHWNTRPVT